MHYAKLPYDVTLKLFLNRRRYHTKQKSTLAKGEWASRHVACRGLARTNGFLARTPQTWLAGGKENDDLFFEEELEHLVGGRLFLLD